MNATPSVLDSTCAPAADSVLFITRKYPPARGGMEEFSARLLECYPAHSYHAVLQGSQWRLPFLLARGLTLAWRHRERIAVVHLGDGLLTIFAGLFRAAAHAPVSATLHGREVERDQFMYRALLRRGLRRVDGPVTRLQRVSRPFGCRRTGRRQFSPSAV